MKTTLLEIRNFRNIGFKSYALGKCNIVVGKNHTGKTNSIESILWTLSGKQLNGSADDIAIKPIGKSNAEVSVRFAFISDDGREHTIEKTYQEKWTKIRGSENLTLTGHETKYKVDCIEQKKNTDALVEIDRILGMQDSKFNNTRGLEKYQAIMNPLYLGDICEWKVLRSLITSIVGDVTRDDVIDRSPSVQVADETLSRFGFDVNKAIIFCNQQIKDFVESVKIFETKISLLESTEDLSKSEIDSLQELILKTSNYIKQLEEGKYVENPEIEIKRKELEEINAKLKDLDAKEKVEYAESIKDIVSNNQKLEDEVNAKYRLLHYAKGLIEDITARKNVAESKKSQELTHIDMLEQRKAELLNKYKQIKSDEYIETGVSKCPNCGEILNKDELAYKKDSWERNHQQELDFNINLGKKVALDIDSAKKKVEELNTELATIEKDLKDAQMQVERREEDYNNANSLKDNEKQSVKDFEYSTEYKDLTERKASIQNQINDLKLASSNDTNETQMKIYEAKKNKAEYEEKLGIHYNYLSSQKEIEKVVADMKIAQKKIMEFELIVEAVNLFNKTKLEILDERMTKHFGNEVKFVLIKENIKEGSWENVCYPLIIGTQTPYKSGSRSEKVMTGVKIIEIIRRELSLPNLPIIIDEIGELDNESLANLIKGTESQIIASKVDDNYDKPTLKVIA